uniref:Rho-GAP domain-containing protein n=1 Tax=Romanomermis culicivorax TaxID=13658 RepID=A0A915L495_ROMCU
MNFGPKLCGYLLLLPAASIASSRPSSIVSPPAVASGLTSILALILALLASTASAKQSEIRIARVYIPILLVRGCIFDEKRLPEFNDLFIVRDVHSVASLLKMYFRELPNPLLTYHLYNSLIAAVSNQDHTMKILRLHDVIQQLPPPYFRTAEHLMKHLARIGEHCNKTGMTYQNLAIIWTPNLLRVILFLEFRCYMMHRVRHCGLACGIVD